MTESFTNSRTYKILHAILNAGLWISVGVAGIYLILILIYPNSNNDNHLFTNSGLLFDGFILIDNVLDKTGKSSYLFLGAPVLISCVGILCIWMLRDIVNSLRKGSPFTMDNVKRIHIIGWAVFIQVYLRQLISYFYARELHNAYLQSGIDPVVQARFTLIPDGAVLALCIVILAEIFRYGCTLQHEHDTTV